VFEAANANANANANVSGATRAARAARCDFAFPRFSGDHAAAAAHAPRIRRISSRQQWSQ